MVLAPQVMEASQIHLVVVAQIEATEDHHQDELHHRLLVDTTSLTSTLGQHKRV